MKANYLLLSLLIPLHSFALSASTGTSHAELSEEIKFINTVATHLEGGRLDALGNVITMDPLATQEFVTSITSASPKKIATWIKQAEITKTNHAIELHIRNDQKEAVAVLTIARNSNSSSRKANELFSCTGWKKMKLSNT